MENKKIIVVGPPGSGKTHFSDIISKYYNLPVIHLDSFYYDENGKSIGNRAFEIILEELLSKDEGIIEGFYLSTLKERIEWSDIVYFLDLNKDDVYQGLFDRKDIKSSDCRFDRSNEIDTFPEWWNNYETRLRQMVYDCLDGCNKKVIIFHSRKEMDQYSKELK